MSTKQIDDNDQLIKIKIMCVIVKNMMIILMIMMMMITIVLVIMTTDDHLQATDGCREAEKGGG